MQHKIVNGTEGHLKDIVFRETPEGKEAVCAYMQVPRCNLGIHAAHEDVVPVFPQTSSFIYKLRESWQKVCIYHSQLPWIPAWAFTDYRVQGSTLNAAVIDLASAHGLQNGYVMLSRVKSFSRLGILHWFSPHRVVSKIQEDLRHEIDRLEALNDETIRLFVLLLPAENEDYHL